MIPTSVLIYFRLIIFIIIFIITIPTLLFKLDGYIILQAYMPNLDLISTLTTFNSFTTIDDVYIYEPDSIHERISKSIINYSALLGLIFIVIKQSIKNNNVYLGLALSSIMLIITYFAPSLYLAKSMKYMKNKTKSNSIGTIYGLLIVIVLILIEGRLIHYFKLPISKFFKSLLSMGWSL
jgi:hypothetical protein